MSNIFSQLNPVVWIALLVLLVGAVIGLWVLKLVRRGAKKPGDVVKAAKEKMDQQKARKEAGKQAEAAIAAPVASSRLSRIGARSEGEAVPAPSSTMDEEADELSERLAEIAQPVAEDSIAVTVDSEAVADDEPWDAAPASDDDAALAADPWSADASETAAAGAWDESPALDTADHQVRDDAGDTAAEAADETVSAALDGDPVAEQDEPVPAEEPVEAPEAASLWSIPEPAEPVDLSHPAHHPHNWDGLVAIIDVLDGALKRSWSEDHLAPSLRVRLDAARAAAGDEVDDCLNCRSLSAQLAATDLARTINSAAREQAAEIVAVVREFAHSAPFSAQDCGAVMAGLGDIEWMALVVRDGQIEKRTMPLTRHDPEAPLWVAEALTALRRANAAHAAAAAA